MKLDLPPFTLVGATTRAGMLTNPLRDRFGIVSRLEFYTAQELAYIVSRSSRLLDVEIDDTGAFEIARRARGTPRIANRLLRRVRDYAEVRADGRITAAVADAALTMLDVDHLGLDLMDRKLLGAMLEKFGGGPVGLDNLAAAIGESSDTIEDVLEPYLIQQGYLQRTPAGAWRRHRSGSTSADAAGGGRRARERASGGGPPSRRPRLDAIIRPSPIFGLRRPAPMHLLLPDFSAFRVLVCGDVMLDRYWHGATARISPEAPVPVVQVLGDELRAGGAGNVASTSPPSAPAPGSSAWWATTRRAACSRTSSPPRGVECALERVQDAPTITKLRVISRHQQLIRLDFEERFAALHAGRVLAALEAGLGDVDVLVLSDYARAPGRRAAPDRRRARGIPVVVDPKGADFTRYRAPPWSSPTCPGVRGRGRPRAPTRATLVARARPLRRAGPGGAAGHPRRGRAVTCCRRASRPTTSPPARSRFMTSPAPATPSRRPSAAASRQGFAARMRPCWPTLAAGVVVGARHRHRQHRRDPRGHEHPSRPSPTACSDGRGAGRLPARPRRWRAHRGAARPPRPTRRGPAGRLDAARRRRPSACW